MSQMPSTAAPAVSDGLAIKRTGAALPVIIAMALGIVFLYGAGFANSTTIHNAAHDARHGFAFPCH